MSALKKTMIVVGRCLGYVGAAYSPTVAIQLYSPAAKQAQVEELDPPVLGYSEPSVVPRVHAHQLSVKQLARIDADRAAALDSASTTVIQREARRAFSN